MRELSHLKECKIIWQQRKTVPEHKWESHFGYDMKTEDALPEPFAKTVRVSSQHNMICSCMIISEAIHLGMGTGQILLQHITFSQ